MKKLTQSKLLLLKLKIAVTLDRLKNQINKLITLSINDNENENDYDNE